MSSHTEKISRGKTVSLSCSGSLLFLAGPLPLGARLTPSLPARKNKCQAAESACLRTQLAFSQSLFLFRARSHSHAHSNLRTQTQFSSPSLSRALSNFLSISLSYSLRLGLELSQARTRAIEAHLSLSTLLPQPRLSTNGPRDDLPKNPD